MIMDVDFSCLLLLAEQLFISQAHELTKRYPDTSSKDHHDDIHDFFEKASHEAVTLMVFFQILSISFLILKFSSLPNLIIWLSIAFLLYTIYGPYFCLKWLLILASFVWQVCLLLWRHPYLIATSFVGYGLFRVILCVVRKCSTLEGEVYDPATIVMKLDSVETKTEQLTDKTEQLTQQVSNLTTVVSRLEERILSSTSISKEHEGGGRYPPSEWSQDTSPVRYPLDRRRIQAMSSRR